MNEQVLNLVIEVASVQGSCPMYRVGDQFTIRKGYQLQTDRPLCMHALQALSPYYIPLSHGILPYDIGLEGPQGAAYVQCMDPMRYTGGGTVTFRIKPCEKLPDHRYPVALNTYPTNGNGNGNGHHRNGDF